MVATRADENRASTTSPINAAIGFVPAPRNPVVDNLPSASVRGPRYPVDDHVTSRAGKRAGGSAPRRRHPRIETPAEDEGHRSDHELTPPPTTSARFGDIKRAGAGPMPARVDGPPLADAASGSCATATVKAIPAAATPSADPTQSPDLDPSSDLTRSGGELLERLSSVGVVFDKILAGIASCDAEAALAVLGGLARLTARLEGMTVHAQVQLARNYPPQPDNDDEATNGEYSKFAADILAAELRQSPRTMSSRLATAWELAHQLPDALADLTAGLLDHTRLTALHQLTCSLSPGHRAVVESTMLGGSRLASPSQWRRKIHRLVARLDPDAAARRRKRAHADRHIALQALDDGMAALTTVLAAEDARAIFDRVDQIARSDARIAADGDNRPIDARRADVFAALLLGNRREHVAVEIQIIAPVGTLAGLDNDPVELVGYGAIPGEVGRALAADAHWRRVLTDPTTGTVLDLGHRRVPTPALARLVRHQQSRCLFPGCGMPATHTDIDHTVPYIQGGRTALDNLGLLCRHHHVAKHKGGWKLDQPQPGVFTWTSPTSRTYRVDTTTNDEECLLPDEDHRTWRTVYTAAAGPSVASDRTTSSTNRVTGMAAKAAPCPF
jgi:hypothetical protein